MEPIWKLSDPQHYIAVLNFEYEAAFTYGDMRPGCTDKDKREKIRKVACSSFSGHVPSARWWAFRIGVHKAGKGAFDIENVPKLVVDAFCQKQIRKDNSAFVNLGFYPDDTLDHVRIIQVSGERISNGSPEKTKVEVFAFG